MKPRSITCFCPFPPWRLCEKGDEEEKEEEEKEKKYF